VHFGTGGGYFKTKQNKKQQLLIIKEKDSRLVVGWQQVGSRLMG
jgi:hypothetical protein